MPSENLQPDESRNESSPSAASGAPHARQLHSLRLQPVVSVSPPKKKVHFLIIIASFIAATVLIVFAVTFYRLYFTDHVSDIDLVQTSTAHTTYLYPRHWEKHSINSDSTGYGATPRPDRTFRTFFSVGEKNSGPLGIMTRIKSSQDEARQEASNLLDDAAIQKTFTNEQCTSISNVHKTIGSRSTASVLELVRVQATCKEADGNYMAIYSIILGDDGYFRYAALITPVQTWASNEAIFTKMIESVDQSANSSAI